MERGREIDIYKIKAWVGANAVAGVGGLQYGLERWRRRIVHGMRVREQGRARALRTAQNRINDEGDKAKTVSAMGRRPRWAVALKHAEMKWMAPTRAPVGPPSHCTPRPDTFQQAASLIPRCHVSLLLFHCTAT